MSASPAVPSIETDRRRRRVLPPSSIVGLAVAALTVVAFGLVSYRSVEQSTLTADRLTRTQDVLERMQIVLSDLRDTETGQRGYLLTGRELYLEPYNAARAEFGKDFAGARSAARRRAAAADRLESSGSTRRQARRAAGDDRAAAHGKRARGAGRS